jgi:hypothetical protein
MKKLLWLLSAALIAAFIFIVPGSTSAQDTIKIENLQIDPKSAKESANITITADVTNTGTADATYTLKLKVNDEIKDTQEVTIAAEKSQKVSFTIIAGKPGDYIVDLNGISDYFTVQTSFMAMFPPYLWAIIGAIVGVLILFIIVLVAMPSRKKLGPAAKTKGKTTHPMLPPMAGTAMNQGSMPGPNPMAVQNRMPPQMQYSMQPPMQQTMQPPMQPMQQIAPSLFQTPFQTQGPMATPHPPHTGRPMFQLRNLAITPTQLKQGDSVTISAIVSNNGTEHGRYSVVLRIGGIVEGITEVDLAPGTSQAVVFTTLKEEPGTYYVEMDGLAGSFLVIALGPAYFNVSNMAVTPDRVKQGESITVSATVTNAGEIAGSHSLVLKIKGAVEAVEEVHLGPGASQRVAFNVVKNTPGFYQVDLEGLAGRFVVEMEWRG